MQASPCPTLPTLHSISTPIQYAQDKKFNRACAEGREVHDRRLGIDPVTKHRPHDFLHPGWSDDSDGEAAEDRYDDLRPLPASADKLQDCSAEQALLWLRCVACNPMERPKVTSAQSCMTACIARLHAKHFGPLVQRSGLQGHRSHSRICSCYTCCLAKSDKQSVTFVSAEHQSRLCVLQ